MHGGPEQDPDKNTASTLRVRGFVNHVALPWNAKFSTFQGLRFRALQQ